MTTNSPYQSKFCFMPAGALWCDKCQKEVSGYTLSTRFSLGRLAPKAMEITVYCHGESATMDLLSIRRAEPSITIEAKPKKGKGEIKKLPKARRMLSK